MDLLTYQGYIVIMNWNSRAGKILRNALEMARDNNNPSKNVETLTIALHYANDDESFDQVGDNNQDMSFYNSAQVTAMCKNDILKVTGENLQSSSLMCSNTNNISQTADESFILFNMDDNLPTVESEILYSDEHVGSNNPYDVILQRCSSDSYVRERHITSYWGQIFNLHL